MTATEAVQEWERIEVESKAEQDRICEEFMQPIVDKLRTTLEGWDL